MGSRALGTGIHVNKVASKVSTIANSYECIEHNLYDVFGQSRII